MNTKHLPVSKQHNRLLNELIDAEKFTIPREVSPPTLCLNQRLSAFKPKGTQTMTVYRGDFNDASQRGHFSKIWTGKENGNFDITFDTFKARYRHEGNQLKKFWELACDGDPYGACTEMANQISNGTSEFVNWVIDRHTDKVPWSPFVSTTYGFKLANTYASDPEIMSTFKCQIAPDRGIIDANNIGCTGEAGELMVLGWIPASDTKLHYNPLF